MISYFKAEMTELFWQVCAFTSVLNLKVLAKSVFSSIKGNNDS